MSDPFDDLHKVDTNTELPTEADRRAAYKSLYIKAMTDVGVPESFAAETFEGFGEPDYTVPPDEAAQDEMDCWTGGE